MYDEQGEYGVTKWLTIPGRLLLIVSIAGTAGVFMWYFLETMPGAPPGRYPLYFWLVPVGLGGVLFFGVMAWTLEKLGVQVFRRQKQK